MNLRDDTIFIDTETTGLLKPDAIGVHGQPRIIEIYAVKYDSNRMRMNEFYSFVDPEVMIPEEITMITGITNEDVEGQPIFSDLYKRLCRFFMGTRTMVAHNCAFDSGMLAVELMRMDKHFQFPWPTNHVCTVEKSFHIKNRRMKIAELYELATGEEEVKGAHRAKADTLALAAGYYWLEDKGHI